MHPRWLYRQELPSLLFHQTDYLVSRPYNYKPQREGGSESDTFKSFWLWQQTAKASELGKFLSEKFYVETESTPLNWSVCAFSEFLMQSYSASSLKYISLYVSNAKTSILQNWDKRKRFWFVFYVEHIFTIACGSSMWPCGCDFSTVLIDDISIAKYIINILINVNKTNT